jgi:hypothetical protein
MTNKLPVACFLAFIVIWASINLMFFIMLFINLFITS